ncbi:DUF4192 domain-containing protein [Streptomyces sp. NPDC004609]|uniref:DUF4192 domain-containing protein n=1 Tax=Streptomyces sp. NPDC004609 TaxID=3364704 RepID=UPI0036A730D7
MDKHYEPTDRTDEPQITLRGPGELADALPYMLGYHPTDSIVMVALHGSSGRFGGRLRLGIPRSPGEWPPVARQLAESLIEGSERRGSRPDGIVLFLCQDPGDGETSRLVMERLRPLAQRLRTACGALDVPVYEALCISDGRYWSYCCPDERCCPLEGTALVAPGTSVMAAAAAYAGIQVRGSLRAMEARLEPWTTSAARAQEEALDSAAAVIVPRILAGDGRRQVADETIALALGLLRRIQASSADPGPAGADAADDGLITHDEAAAVILGLQDRETRDRAAEWMEGPDAAPALRLWRALARRCVRSYAEHAAPPLTLAGWVAWSTGDEPAARVAIGLALRKDPDYLFARLLHQACNENLDPETLRQCLRSERASRTADRSAALASEARPSPPAEPAHSGGSGYQKESTQPGTPVGAAGTGLCPGTQENPGGGEVWGIAGATPGRRPRASETAAPPGRRAGGRRVRPPAGKKSVRPAGTRDRSAGGRGRAGEESGSGARRDAPGDG